MSVLDRFRLDGRVAVVTGASGGLGAGFALALADAGADVVLVARRAELLAEVAEQVEGLGRRALVVPADVTVVADSARVAAAAVAELGRVDVLVNNAGLGSAVPAMKEAPEEFRAVMEVNLFGAYWMAQACARVMRPGSAIVNISSVLGLVKSWAPQAAYSASKAALIGLTRDLAQQWSGRYGIRVNALAPGYFATDMTAAIPGDAVASYLRANAPLGRMGEQEELDSALLFLASPASSYVTGVVLPVDGGISMP